MDYNSKKTDSATCLNIIYHLTTYTENTACIISIVGVDINIVWPLTFTACSNDMEIFSIVLPNSIILNSWELNN